MKQLIGAIESGVLLVGSLDFLKGKKSITKDDWWIQYEVQL
jgi:hypothetical protein